MLAGCRAGRVTEPEDSSEVRAALSRALETHGDRAFSGVVLVQRGEETIFEAAVGFADREASRPMAVDTRFVIASLSKQLTAALVLRQVDAGELQLDGVVSSYVSALDEAWAQTATVGQLLNHTSGVPEEPGEDGGAPGVEFRYSNRGYALLGEILERASGMAFEEQLVELDRLCGMEDSAAAHAKGLARGYVEGEGGELEAASTEGAAAPLPAGGMVSSALDLARWNRCLHEEPLLSAQSHRRMVEATAVRDHRWGTLGYGYGLQLSDEGGIVEYSHSGYVPGYISTMAYYPQTQLSFIVLENTSWSADDMERVFSVHDRLRRVLRESSLVEPTPRTHPPEATTTPGVLQPVGVPGR
jgi:CubicO group peptidase (beta-lactamase class C family)